MGTSTKKSHKRILTGLVVSDKMDKTIVVEVEELSKHPLYGKYVRRSKRVKAHDEKNDCQLNDMVKVVECRRLSKDKSWRLLEVVRRAK